MRRILMQSQIVLFIYLFIQFMNNFINVDFSSDFFMIAVLIKLSLI